MGNCWRRKQVVNKEQNEIKLSDATETMRQSNDGIVAVALYSLHTKDAAIVSFEKGDKLIIENDSDPDWYLVRHIKNQSRGFAPKSYLITDIPFGIEEWFFGDINRADAERLLLQHENKAGTFLIRNSHAPGAYALSIKAHNGESSDTAVKHYKIGTLDHGGYFISPATVFSTLKELVAYYSDSNNGLCRKLQYTCPRPRPVIPGPLPDARDEYEIPFESLQFIRPLGKGNFGEVFFGYWNGTLEVAIKTLTSDGVHAEEFRREVAVMKAINHPKIVRLYAVCTEKVPFCIVMEYLCNGNLLHFLRSSHGKKLKLPTLVNMAAQIAEGMKYLESNNLIHRDLAARNILVGDENIVKLADFGLARIMDEAIYITKGGKLPIKWTAPEACTTGHFTIKSDVWSFGIVLYEIFTHGEMPYKGMKNQQVSELVTKHDYRMSKPNDPECSEAVYQMMMLCWKTKPEERPTFDFLHHYFLDYYITSETSYKEAECCGT